MATFDSDSSAANYNQLMTELAALRQQVSEQQLQLNKLQGVKTGKADSQVGAAPMHRRRMLGGLTAGILAAGGAFVVNAAPASATGATLNGDVVFTGSGSVTLPTGSTAQRPANTAAGQLRFNSSLGVFETYLANNWMALSFAASFRGALVYRTSAQTIPYGAPPATPISFQAINYDTDNIFSLADPTKLTVPAGVSKVRLVGNLRYGDPGTSTQFAGAGLLIRKAGQNFTAMPHTQVAFPANGAGGIGLNVISPIYSVQAGDYFQLQSAHSLTNSSATPISWDTDTTQSTTWFSMEIIA